MKILRIREKRATSKFLSARHISEVMKENLLRIWYRAKILKKKWKLRTSFYLFIYFFKETKAFFSGRPAL